MLAYIAVVLAVVIVVPQVLAVSSLLVSPANLRTKDDEHKDDSRAAHLIQCRARAHARGNHRQQRAHAACLTLVLKCPV